MPGSRGKGRGRGHGRGRGRKSEPVASTSSNTQSPIEQASIQVRSQRAVEAANSKKLDASVRKELLEQKRKAQLHRVLLPGAPPRKMKRKGYTSPERHSPMFLDHAEAIDNNMTPDADWAVPEAVFAVIPASDNLTPAASPAQRIQEVKIEYVEANEDGVEQSVHFQMGNILDFDADINQPSTSGTQAKPSSSEPVDEDNLEAVVDQWVRSLGHTDSDDDELEDDDTKDGIPLPTVTRDATDEPADSTGLTTAEALLIQKHEEHSDRHLRSIVTNNDYLDFPWTQDKDSFTGKRETFTGTAGPTSPVSDSIVDIFYKMFDCDFIDLIVSETNRYAEQILSQLTQDPRHRHSRKLRWTPTNRDEVISFLAVVILQGLNPKAHEEAYFSFDGYNTTPYYGAIMSYNRFNLLKNMMHFVNNDNNDMTKLYKIRPVIDYLNRKFSSLYMPGQNICIDESLLKWHGRLSFSQKIANKAAKVGVKTYELCDSSNGYLWSFIVYTGKDEPARQQTDGRDDELQDSRDDNGPDNNRQTDSGPNDDVRPTNATAKIVYDLMEPLLHKGHTLVMDNFYNSPLLARCLKRDGQTDVYGTLRLSREFVPETMKTLTKSDLRQGEAVVTYCTDLAVMVWRDSNLVSMISTYHPLQIGAKDDSLPYKPAIVLDYNKNMGGVDRKDQYLANQPFERHRNKTWYKKLFRRLYNAALFNCFVIYTSNGSRKISHRQFRTRLAEDLLKIHRGIDLTKLPRLLNKRKRTKATTTTTTTTSIVTTSMRVINPGRPSVPGEHFPARSLSKNTRCWMCTRTKKHSRTAYKCAECDVPLCIIGCFRSYHKP